MLDSFLIVGKQVLILFVLIAVGVVCRVTGILRKEHLGSVTDLMLYVITPCVLIDSFQRPFEREIFRNFCLAILIAGAVHLLAVVLATLLIREPDRRRRAVLRFGVVFSNCGYMSLPLQSALLGDEGVFYAAAYIAVFTVMSWTYGLHIMSQGQERFSWKTIALNPGILSIAVGLLFFFTSFTLPDVLGKPIESLAALNTPLPMLIIGFYVAGLDRKTLFRTSGEFAVLGLRLLLVPLLALGGMYLCGVRGTLLVSCTVSACAPVAALSTMFATKYKMDAELSASTVTVSTLLSVVTMTLIVGLATILA